MLQYPLTTRQGNCTNGDGCDVVGVPYNKATVTVGNNGFKCCSCSPPSSTPSPTPTNTPPHALKVRGAGVGSIVPLANTPPGMLACFGSNAAGALGIGDAATAFTSQQNAPGIVVQAPESAPADAPFLWLAVSVFAAGDGSVDSFKMPHACGIAADSSAWCWGANSRGQLGANLPLGATSALPRAVVLGNGSALQLRAVSCGFQFTCGITASPDASLVCFGDNSAGQLGEASSPSFRAFAAPVQILYGSDAAGPFATVSAGSAHVCALGLSGRVYCWGACASGQCGIGDSPLALWPAQPIAATPPALFVDLASGPFHSCATDTSGVVSCWGRGAEGQLGRPVASAFSATPRQVGGSWRFGASGLAAGLYASCGISDSGPAVC